MTEQPLVSIIIPNYNHDVFLKQRLDSVFNQTYQNFEVILLDDASTDASLPILKKYQEHPKVSHFEINETNSGSSFKQWQKGIALAKGEYIWIAESDDYCEPVFLEKLSPFFEKDIVLIHCASMNVDESNEISGLNKWAHVLDSNKWQNNYVNNGEDEIKNFLRYRNTLPNASAVIFKNILHPNEIPINMKYCGDWFLWITILHKGKIAYLNEPLNYFRSHTNSTRTNKNFQTEKKRFNEYFFIITKFSNIISRWVNRKHYNWILREWKHKSKEFPSNSIFKTNIPIDFLIRHLLKRY